MLPPYLTAGDRVAMAAPARKITLAEIEPAVALLRYWNFEPVIGKTIDVVHHQYAGDDAWRTADLQTLFDDPTVRAVWCARGGYGTVRLLDSINWDGFHQHPKWLIGYSDITALHSHLQAQFKLASIHATMPINVATNTPDSLNYLHRLLVGQLPIYTFAPHPLNRTGQARGTLVGGNLSVIYSLTNSISEFDWAGKVLFLEDIDEYLYHIDRMLCNLRRSGRLKQLAGLVVGGMTDIKDNLVPFGQPAESIVAEHTAGYDYPIAFGFSAGHQAENWPLLLGTEVALQVTDEKTYLCWDDRS